MLTLIDDTHPATAVLTYNDVRRDVGADTNMANLRYNVAPPGEFHDLLGEIDPSTYDRHLHHRILMQRSYDAFIHRIMAPLDDPAPSITYADLVAAASDPDFLRKAEEEHKRRHAEFLERGRRVTSARIAAQHHPCDPGLRFYDAEHRCVGCRRHIAEACAKDCPRNSPSRRDAAMAELRRHRPHCNLDGPCDPDCPGPITQRGQQP